MLGFHHENILQILDVFAISSQIHVVLPVMEKDLFVIRNEADVIRQQDVKSFIKMLLQGINISKKTWDFHRIAMLIFLF